MGSDVQWGRWHRAIHLCFWTLLFTASSGWMQAPLTTTDADPISYNVSDCFYLYIGNLNITLDHSSITSESLAKLEGVENYPQCNVDQESPTIYYARLYNNSFWLNFTFEKDPSSTNQVWWMSKFQHHNKSEHDKIFSYSGVEYSIRSSSDMSYFCDNLTFAGQGGDPVKKSTVQFQNLRVQAFSLKGTKPSKTYSHCGKYSRNNFTINVVIGLVVGGALFVAVVTIIVTLIVKKCRNRGYDLLVD